MKGGIKMKVGDYQMLFSSLLLSVLVAGVHSQIDQPPFIPIPDAQQKGAVCNDGSPAGYYYVAGSGEGLNNWHIFLEGGGWCRSDETCAVEGYFRTSKQSTNMNFTGILSSNQTLNPDLYNWNKVYIHYCDGGSFLGDTQVKNFQLRGTVIFNAVMDELFAKGLGNATNAILSGASAGGLATMLHCDIFKQLLPNATRLKCLSDSGFFLRAPDLPYNDYRDRVFVQTIEYRNLTNSLPITCTSTNASLCLYPEYFVAGIKTPLFILNSVFDKFQVHDNLQPRQGNYEGWRNCTNDLQTCKPVHRQVITAFRNEFLQALEKLGDNPSRGMYINSCYVHVFMHLDSMWNSDVAPRLGNKTMSQAFGDWYFDRSPINLIDTHNDWPVDCSIHRSD